MEISFNELGYHFFGFPSYKLSGFRAGNGTSRMGVGAAYPVMGRIKQTTLFASENPIAA
jgi:hypothetical protein